MTAKIVVADDSRTQRSTIALALERKGHQVIQGSNGLEAITLAYRESPDLLVSDVVMPELNGYQVCRLLKDDPAMADLPIILLTTLDHQEHRFWGKEAGADSYVLKSADSAPLEKEVDRLLKEKRRLPEKECRREGSTALPRQRIHTRLTDLLDRLLFEATIANRIREVGRFRGDLKRSLAAFFEFFQGLIDYQVALLFLRSSDPPQLIAHLQGNVQASLVEKAKETLWKEFPPMEKEKIQEQILNPTCLSQGKPASDAGLAALIAPFALEEGGLAVFSTNLGLYTEQTNDALKIAARELDPVLRFNLQAEAIDRLKADFTAMIIHDLRSPLTNVMAVVSMMEDGMFGPINEEQKTWLGKIETSAGTLVDLVSDFLDLSKLEAGHLELIKEETDLGLLVQNCVENYSLLARDKQASLKAKLPRPLPKIQADPRRLDQVLMNLITNSIKFTPDKGEIEVGAGVGHGAEIKVWVRDNGVGIPAQEIEQIFQKYRQTTSGKASKRKGTGLGLVICKMIVEAHGGRIWVESEERKGTTFFFSLPLNLPKSNA
jgi:signal transduction histidine kinase